jgi:hypothetical protein
LARPRKFITKELFGSPTISWGGAGLDDAALAHDDDLVRQLHGLGLIVGDEEAGHVELLMQGAQPLPQLVADARVQGAERLVQQEDLGVRGEGAGEGDALPLAAGDLVREAPLHTLQA